MLEDLDHSKKLNHNTQEKMVRVFQVLLRLLLMLACMCCRP